MNQPKNSTVGTPLPGFADFCRTVAAEGAVLIQNDGQLLPIKKGAKVAVFGRSQIDYYRCGTGSGGAINIEYTTNLLNGLRNNADVSVNEELAQFYTDFIAEHPFDNGGGMWACEPLHQVEPVLSEELVERTRKESETAVFVIGRTAGEDQDNQKEAGSYLLTETEIQNLTTVTKYYDQVAVVLNVPNIMDMNWIHSDAYKNPIQAVIYAWQGGMEGGNAIADVLTGRVTPSGKLPDTIAYSIDDYPSSSCYGDEDRNCYQEDIYVGYRYFETFAPQKVQYEFGYGLSYTQFELTTGVAQKQTIHAGNDTLIVPVTIRNTGSLYSGKEVVQLYVTAPQGKLGKPAKVLAAFSKTKELEPGEEQTLELKVSFDSLASYDDRGVTGHKSCYVLEAGTYRFEAGNSVRGTECVANCEVPELIVTRECEEALAPTVSFDVMKPGRQKEDGTYEITFEPVAKQTIDLGKRIQDRLPKTLPMTGNRDIKLQDVAAGRASMEEFIAQLSKEELATIVRGEGMSNPRVTLGTASAFGGVSEALFSYGIPIACTADGPAGIRMESGMKATQVPIGTLIAATWNLELAEQMYIMEGRELVRNEIDALLGPGVNIHRSPYNGRNFEYFSEEPLLAGKFAAAAALGIHKGGAYATLKHFACNNQEKRRSFVDAAVSERAVREIYLKAFEMAVRESGATSIMTSYNPINGHWAASNYDLNTTILRKEWGYDGIVMTDWWAKMNDVVTGGEDADGKYTSFMVRAQNDLYMVVNNDGAEINSGEDNTLEALEAGTLTIGELQRCAMNICRFLIKAPVMNRRQVFEQIHKSFATKHKAQNMTEVSGTAGKSQAAEQSEVTVMTDGAKVQITEGRKLLLEVPETATYQIIVHMISMLGNLSQCSSRITIDGEDMLFLQTRGTNGKWVTQKLMTADFTKGIYELEVNQVKSGLTIEWIQFVK